MFKFILYDFNSSLSIELRSSSTIKDIFLVQPQQFLFEI